MTFIAYPTSRAAQPQGRVTVASRGDWRFALHAPSLDGLVDALGNPIALQGGGTDWLQRRRVAAPYGLGYRAHAFYGGDAGFVLTNGGAMIERAQGTLLLVGKCNAIGSAEYFGLDATNFRVGRDASATQTVVTIGNIIWFAPVSSENTIWDGTVTVFRWGPSGREIWKEGVLIASTTSAPGASAHSGNLTILGVSTNSDINIGMLAHSPQWLDAERLSVDPWSIFKSGARRLYFDVPAGADEVQADTAIRWNMQAAATKAAAIRWNAQQAVQQTATVRWSLLQAASASAIVRWNAEARVVKTASVRWDLLSAAQADSVIAWQLLEAAQSDASIRWSMLEAVQADTAILWNIAETLGLVTSEFVARWSMLAPAQTDASVHWNLLQAVSKDTAARWDMLQSAERAEAVRWSLVEAVRADRSLRWAMLGAVRMDATASWNLLQAVQRDAALRWDLITAGVVFATFDVRWSMLAAVEKAVAARWDLLESLQVDAGLRWDIVSAVTAEALVRWDLLASAQVELSAVIRWDVLSASQRDVVIRWRIGDASTLTPINVHLVPAERRLFVVPPENRITVVAPARGTPFTTH